MNLLKKIIFLFFLFVINQNYSQSRLNLFLKPSDSLDKTRRNAVVLSEAILGAGTLVALHQTWYANYPKSNFHIINDNAEWLQMDKMGHAFSSYQTGRFCAQILKWSGASRKSQLWYGAPMGFVFLSTVEVFDGYSSEWGFSWGDIAANAVGTSLYVSQELLWKEQRIQPKFSFHTTPYAGLRPEVLGATLPEQILKDYNGETFWLSVNLHSFFKTSKIPQWLNFAVGYGAEGMITGNDQLVNTVFFPEKQRTRQFYFSLDADLTKIKTKSHILKTLFSVFNTIKIPAPTIEINNRGEAKWHSFYF